MHKIFWSTCLAACVCFTSSNLQAQTQVQQSTIKGGVAGAIIGGIIGNQNDETAGGAAIGAALGALTGNVVGKSQQQQVIREQQHFQHQQEILNRAVSVDDAITLTRSGVNDELIINQVLKYGVQQQIGVSEVISLHQNGVRESVIQAMQSAPIGQANVQPIYQQPIVTKVVTPVVVKPVPRVIVHPTPVYRRPAPTYYRGYSSPRYGSPRGGKYRGGGKSGGSIRIGF